MTEWFLSLLLQIPAGGQLALPVVDGEKQNHYRPQDYGGAESAVHPSASWRVSVCSECLLLASICWARAGCQSKNLCQKSGAYRCSRESCLRGESLQLQDDNGNSIRRLIFLIYQIYSFLKTKKTHSIYNSVEEKQVTAFVKMFII